MKLFQTLTYLVIYIAQGILVALTLFLVRVQPKIMFNLGFDLVVLAILNFILPKLMKSQPEEEKVRRIVRFLLLGSLFVFIVPIIGFLCAGTAFLLCHRYLTGDSRKRYLRWALLVLLLVINFQSFSVANVTVGLEE